MKFVIAAAMAAAALAASSARAAQPDDADASDVRCLAVASMMAGQAGADPQQQQAAFFGVAYYLGKLDGRSPQLDIEKRLRDAAAALTQETAQTESKRCAEQLGARGQAMQAIAGRLSQAPAGAK